MIVCQPVSKDPQEHNFRSADSVRVGFRQNLIQTLGFSGVLRAVLPLLSQSSKMVGQPPLYATLENWWKLTMEREVFLQKEVGGEGT